MKSILFLFIIIVLNCSGIYSYLPPLAEKGILDLRKEKSFFEPKSQIQSLGSSIKLNGQWGFYWSEFLNPEIEVHPNTFMNVPSQWQQNGYPVEGYATYTLKVLLPDKTELTNLPGLGLALTDMGSGYEMFINGVRVSENGKVGKSKEETELFQKYLIKNLPDFACYDSIKKTREMNIIIYISNFHYLNAGLWNSIKLGAHSNILQEHNQKLALDITVFSALLIMALYHFGLFLNRRKDLSPLYFGLFCISIAIRTLSIQERLIIEFIPQISFGLVHRVEFLTIYFSAFFSLFFIQSLFHAEFSDKVFYIFSAIFIPAILSVAFLPMELYKYSLPVFQITLILEIFYIIFVSLLAMKRKRIGARLFFSALIIFAITIINDILVANGILHFRYTTSYGLLVLIIFQSTVLSRKFASAFLQAETLRDELKKFANNLEVIVHERTMSLEVAMKEIEAERQKSEDLLLNIIPKDIAIELKEKGYADPILFESVSVMFTDFKDFTRIAETMKPKDLIHELDMYFVQFDKITEQFGLEKLKTIGDSYMCAAGIPKPKSNSEKSAEIHAIDTCLAGLEILEFIKMLSENKMRKNKPVWEIRIGIHSGPLVAGVIGEKKFAYDVWGDTVNIASRMESNGIASKINISGHTYDLINNLFDCEYRGKISVKNRGEIDMYFVLGLKKEFSKNGDSKIPNEKFWEFYRKI